MNWKSVVSVAGPIALLLGWGYSAGVAAQRLQVLEKQVVELSGGQSKTANRLEFLILQQRLLHQDQLERLGKK